MSGFPIPGSHLELVARHAPDGALERLAVGATVHLERLRDGAWRLGGDLCTVRELPLPHGLRRHVRAVGETWTERYEWDAEGRPTLVDGVTILRGDGGRVVGCTGGGPDWSYGYDRHGLSRIDGPHGAREIVRGAHGRPVRVRDGEAGRAIAYDDEGRRADSGEDPPGWSRDAIGRLWTVRDAGGEIVATYLWNGFHCLGRIDGPPDAPLAAAFMLDPTGTPVRVVTRRGARRIPRDAFGEALLGEPGVPGLFGGPVHEGLVRLPARALDPRTGAFDRLDPLHGAPDDPRRADGFAGLLPVDRAPDGAYAVCRNDPVARSDPSGGISLAAIPLVFSSLTWSSQYNIVNFVFLQLFANLLPSLFTTDKDGDWAMGRWFSMEGIASQRGGGFGLRFDPVGLEAWIKLFAGAPRRFTLHHVFWSPQDDEAFGGTQIIRMFAPDADYEPGLYGTVLRAEPARLARFLLRGSVPGFPTTVVESWSRLGGAAVETFPGSRVPRFPGGGLHFGLRAATDDPVEEARGPQSGRIVELAPGPVLPQGTATQQARLRLPRTGLGLSVGADVVVFGPDSPELHQVRAAVERDGATTIRLAVDLATAAASGLRVRGATPSAQTEDLPLVGVDRLDARAPTATVAYAKDDVVQLTQAGAPAGVRSITALEARITLDEAPPAGLRLPWEVFAAQLAGTAQDCGTAGADAIQFGAGQTPPGRGESILVSSSTASLALRITEELGATQRRVDRSVAGLTGSLTWRPLAQGPRLGLAEAAPATTTLTYTPDASGLAPASGTQVLFVSGEEGAARSVTALDADELVLNAQPTGAGSPVTVRKIALGDPDVTGATALDVIGVALAPVGARGDHTLLLLQLSSAGLPLTTPSLAGLSVTGNTAALTGAAAATASTTPVALSPGVPAGVTAGGSTTAVLVKALRAKVALDRPLGFAVGTRGLELVRLGPSGFVYGADRLDALRILVRPQARVSPAPAFEPTELPRFADGEPVEVSFTGGTPRCYRIAGAQGGVLGLSDGPDLPAGAAGLTVQRLDALDPGTGGSRIGRDAEVVSRTAATSEIVAGVWALDALRADRIVAVTDGTTAFPARITACTELTVEWHPAALAGTPATVDLAPLDVARRVLVPRAVQEEDDILVEIPTGTAPAPITPGPDTVLAVDFSEEVAAAEGRFTAGSIRVPEEPTYELSRHQALVDHEMVHTMQSAIWGPVLLSPIPFRGIEDIFEAANKPFPPALHHAGKLYSVGGIMNFLTTTLLSGIAWVVLKLFFFFKRLIMCEPLSFGWLGHADWLPFHAATLPESSRPTRIRLGAAGSPELTPGDLIEITDGRAYRRATVTAADGATIDLDAPAPGGGSLQVAVIHDDDDTSFVEHAVMRHTGFGFAERAFDLVFDPWTTLTQRATPTPNSFADILRRCARDLFGSSSWTLFPFGYFFWDNAVNNRGGGGHMSKMEQSASESSGDLYSPIGRLAGEIAMVGDIARYWHFVDNRHDRVVAGGRQDAPGVHVNDLVRVLPSARPDPAVTAAAPNGTVASAPDAERPGDQLPDALVGKRATGPGAAPLPGPRSFAPLPTGFVPVGPEVEGCVGMYVAFTRPAAGADDAAHRVTTMNGVAGAANAVEAQEAGKQTFWYDLDADRVKDVAVTVAGLPAAEGARMTLLRGQAAAVAVAGAGARVFAVDVLRPADGPVVRATGAELQAQDANGVEPAEVVRVYAVDATSRRHTDAALTVHGMHLARELRIPVRRLEVEVTDVIPVRLAPDPREPALSAPLLPGADAYVVIPIAPTDATLGVASVTYPGGAPAAVTDPVATITGHPPSAAVLPLVAPGVIYKLHMGVNEPPEAPARLNLELPPGTGRPAAMRLVATIDLTPHFTLDGPSLDVARGATLTLACSGGVTPGDVVVSPAAGAATTIAGTSVQIAIDAGAAIGRRTVLVTDAADAGHKARRTFTVT